MGVVKSFNGLIGTKTKLNRTDINVLIIDAKQQEQYELAERLQKALTDNPTVDEFKFSKNTAPAIESVPESFLQCLDCEQDSDDTIIGLGKAVSADEIYQMITDKMIEKIKLANTKDYKQKWSAKKYGTGYLMPFNFVSKKMYRGVNRYLLTDFEPLKNPFFMTFKQIESLGGMVNKGAKGYPVVYFTELYKYYDSERKVDIASYDLKKFIALLNENRDKIPFFAAGQSAEDIAKRHKLPILKYYNVFNGIDITGIDFDLKNFKHGLIEKPLPAAEEYKMPIAEAIIKNYPVPAPGYAFGGNEAFYSPRKDTITMPHIYDFEAAQDYYATFFHEIAHSTGHQKRLQRDFSGKFGSKNYAFEELIAEFTATFLSAEAGIIWHTDKNFPAYLKSWNNRLTHLQDDNRFLMRAATQAQAATDYLLQYNSAGEPKYFEDLKQAAKEKAAKEKKEKKEKAKAQESKAKAKPVATRKRKSSQTKQLNLFGLNGKRKASGLKGTEVTEPQQINNTPIEIPQPQPQPQKNPRVKNIGAAANEVPAQFFTVAGEVGKFLQAVERKPEHSVVITMDGEQGAGKTTTLYKFMNAFATPGNRCLFISGEEHPNSSLAKEKVEKYLSGQAQANIDTVGDVEDKQDLYDLVKDYEIIFIDSWQKLLRMVGTIHLDEDLRKRFNGKVFVIIFQQTTTGRTKGGSEVVFDGDIIIKMVKEASFADNYAFFDKNRYTKVPIETIRYNIATGTVYNPLEPETEAEAEAVATEINELNFEVI
ncbi:DUF1738 domain-containing protein [Flavobacterium alkalisoli]|uniref:DUF1738 domain-containing protein n=1 Tax=Flavobacterium alkalisoli TaxID=2602769 RepID=A0A5B9FV72_9FLAO|nr:zincin-like metallopeptidase domain-containing protein [Flavobacterium alkalisoli]QEE49598.1 DUF1738 domain-containing protein [Flavobacterium alkalisoli]